MQNINNFNACGSADMMLQDQIFSRNKIVSEKIGPED